MPRDLKAIAARNAELAPLFEAERRAVVAARQAARDAVKRAHALIDLQQARNVAERPLVHPTALLRALGQRTEAAPRPDDGARDAQLGIMRQALRDAALRDAKGAARAERDAAARLRRAELAPLFPNLAWLNLLA